MLKFLKNNKNAIVSKGIEKFITIYLERKRLGKLTNFKLDSKKRTINITFMLRKETLPLEIIINNYNFVKEEDKGYFTFESITTSKDWSSSALETIIGKGEKRVPIPKKYLKVVEIFI